MQDMVEAKGYPVTMESWTQVPFMHPTQESKRTKRMEGDIHGQKVPIQFEQAGKGGCVLTGMAHKGEKLRPLPMVGGRSTRGKTVLL